MRPRIFPSLCLLALGTLALDVGVALLAHAALTGYRAGVVGPGLALAGFAVLVGVFLANLAAEERRERRRPYVWNPAAPSARPPAAPK
jgi:hypothetical protein